MSTSALVASSTSAWTPPVAGSYTGVVRVEVPLTGGDTSDPAAPASTGRRATDAVAAS